MNKPSAVPDKCLLVFCTNISLQYQARIFQSLSFYTTCMHCYQVFLLVPVPTVKFGGTQGCTRIAGALCGHSAVLFMKCHWHVAFSRVPNSAWKGRGLLRSAAGLGEKNYFLGKWIYENFWYWCCPSRAGEELGEALSLIFFNEKSIFCRWYYFAVAGAFVELSCLHLPSIFIYFFFLPQIPDLQKGDGGIQLNGEGDSREAI